VRGASRVITVLVLAPAVPSSKSIGLPISSQSIPAKKASSWELQMKESSSVSLMIEWLGVVVVVGGGGFGFDGCCAGRDGRVGSGFVGF